MTAVHEKVFDYIVVGGGSSGCVIAGRLSEDPNVKVLLIEAGPPFSSLPIQVPAAPTKLQRTEIDWQFTSEPTVSTKNRVHILPRGKILGGCSILNWMVFVRGNPRDYDRWAEQGCTGWDYENLLPYFKKLEKRIAKGVDPNVRGTNGPVPITDHSVRYELTDAYVKASVEAGLTLNHDYNSGNQEGVSYMQSNIYQGKRQDTFTCYVKPHLSRPNLVVAANSIATGLLYRKKNQVSGVTLSALNNKSQFTVYCRKEVIISCGSFGSPQFLMVSGIGPREDLEKHSIKLVKELPVGYNYREHMNTPMRFTVKKGVSITTKLVESWYSIFQYVVSKSGPLATQGLESTSFIKTRPELDRPDLQIHFFPTFLGSFYRLNAKIELPGGEDPRHGVLILPTLLHPKSAGRIRLASKNIQDKPIIEGHYLEDEEDIQVLRYGMRLIRNIVKQPAFLEYLDSEVVDDTIPFPPDSDEYLTEYILRYTVNLYHPMGTCKMGTDPATSVVDPSLRVHGFTNLRVADCSIFPDTVSGNTNAPAMMVGEVASDLIKKDLTHQSRL